MIAAIHKGESPDSASQGLKAARIKAKVLVCIPGTRPLTMPSRKPIIVETISILRSMLIYPVSPERPGPYWDIFLHTYHIEYI
jgi:uncharacterized membrane protein (UPF0136 family)